jgi:hypothetical protein
VIVELSAAITSIRIAQNEAWQLVCVSSGARSAPSSIHEGYNAISKRRSTGAKNPSWLAAIPPGLRRLVSDYWEKSGRALTAHRDVDQHHAVVATGCFLRFEHGRLREMSIVLPDNPETKSPREFTHLGRVNGVEFVREAFGSLHDVVEGIARHHVTTTAPLGLNFTPAPKIDHAEAIERPTALVLFDYAGGRGIILGQTEDRRVTVTTLPVGADALPSTQATE